MKIEFTVDQFRQLLKFSYLGRWMITSHSEKPDQSLLDFDQHILSQAKKMGINDLVEFDPNENSYSPSPELDEEMESIIREYDDFTFWDELAWQMAERDFARKFDHAQILCMTTDEIFREKNVLADKYFDEFSENGVENLKVST